jgi:hypothetical protein
MLSAISKGESQNIPYFGLDAAACGHGKGGGSVVGGAVPSRPRSEIPAP